MPLPTSLGPDRRGEAIVAVVGPGHRLVDVAKRVTETTGPNTSRCTISSSCTRAGDDRRLVEEAFASAALAAGRDLDVACLAGALHESLHAAVLAPGNERADVVLVVVRPGELDAL